MYAVVVELVDTLASGVSVRKDVEVRNACGISQGNLPLATMLPKVKFRGRGT